MKHARGISHLRSGIFCCCLVSLASALVLWGCGRKTSTGLKDGLSRYRENKLEEALPLLERAVQEDKESADACAWLAETYRRLGKKDKCVESARKALVINPCHSFAHTALADDFNPMYGLWEGASSDSTWSHLQKAVACDSTDGNAWVSLWTESMRRGDLMTTKRSVRSLIMTGFLTRAALAYGRWMLRNLPEHAILVTNGDMDTYPPVALQEVDSVRPDVAVVNRSLLNTVWYARFIRDHSGVRLPFGDARLDSLTPRRDQQGRIVTQSDQILQEWLRLKSRGEFSPPLAFSVTVDTSVIPGFGSHFRMCGAYYMWVSDASKSHPDANELRTSLAGINPDDFAGPFVSAQDRSPIRGTYTKQLAMNVTGAAIVLSELLVNSGQAAEAKKTLSWADAFEKKTEMGPVFTVQIAHLRESANK